MTTLEQSRPSLASRLRLTPLARLFLLIGLGSVLATVLGALTGEKTTFLFKEVLHLNASALGTLGILLGLPAYLQPFMGAWTDLKPLFGYHRRSYYLLGHLAGTVGLCGLAFLHPYRLAAVVCLLLITGFVSIFSSVIINAVMVALGNPTGMFGRLRTLAYFIPYILSLAFTSHLSGFVTQNWSYERAYGTAALLSLLYVPLAFLLADKRIMGETRQPVETEEEHRLRIAERDARHARNLTLLKESMKQPGLWALVGFIFYLILTPGPNATYYFADGLHLSKQFIGDNGRWLAAGALLGMGLFALGSRSLPVISLVLGAYLMDCIGYPVQLLMHDAPSVHWMTLLSATIGIIYNLCLFTLAARACPRGLEGTIYGLVMAAIALSSNLTVALGSWIYDYCGPDHGHTITYGWNASLIVGLVFTLGTGFLIPFMPAWTRSRQPLRNIAE